MALVNHAKREINAKVVYFGPGLSGKATNLHHIYKKLKPSCRGPFKSMNVQMDKMLFFDFMPPGQASVGGYQVRYHVYTMTGNVTGSSSWKMVLKGVDGVVFVADSGPDSIKSNQESLKNLQFLLEGFGTTLQDIPCILQYNKCDLPSSVPVEELEHALNVIRLPVLNAVAIKGEGVLDTIFNLLKMVMKKLADSGLLLEKVGEQELPSPVPIDFGLPGEPERFQPPSPLTSSSATAEQPVIEFTGQPVLLSGGGLRLPLVVRGRDTEQRGAITITISLEQD